MSRSLRTSEFANTPDYKVCALKKQLKQTKNKNRIGSEFKSVLRSLTNESEGIGYAKEVDEPLYA